MLQGAVGYSMVYDKNGNLINEIGILSEGDDVSELRT